ncbi:MAG TPA: SET domain-containing protein [Stellaceae bacterium]|nr:SET domain-containing protein [Stellaceae bacterium]
MAGLERLRPAPNHHLEIRDDPAKGRGIFTREAIAAGVLIEAAPVVIIPPEQCAAVDRTVLHDYYFHWDGDPDGIGSGAVALGLVSLCNHSRRPSARVRRNLARATLDLIAARRIEVGEEITIDYNCALWFEARE